MKIKLITWLTILILVVVGISFSTDIFTVEDFEDNNYNGWSSYASGILAIESASPINGTYSLRTTGTQVSGGRGTYFDTNLSTTNSRKYNVRFQYQNSYSGNSLFYARYANNPSTTNSTILISQNDGVYGGNIQCGNQDSGVNGDDTNVHSINLDLDVIDAKMNCTIDGSLTNTDVYLKRISRYDYWLFTSGHSSSVLNLRIDDFVINSLDAPVYDYLFIDEFTRNDNASVGNNWEETENVYGNVSIKDNTLLLNKTSGTQSNIFANHHIYDESNITYILTETTTHWSATPASGDFYIVLLLPDNTTLFNIKFHNSATTEVVIDYGGGEAETVTGFNINNETIQWAIKVDNVNNNVDYVNITRNGSTTKYDAADNNGYSLSSPINPSQIKFLTYGANAGTTTRVSNVYVCQTYPCNTTTPSSDSFIITTNITTFNATVNGTEYTTTNGTIITGLSNQDALIDIIIHQSNYFNNTFLNYNISSDISTNMERYPLINTHNQFNKSKIMVFNVTIGATTYSTNNGDLYIPYNGTYNATYDSENYINKTIESSFLPNGFYNQTLYQSILTITTTEISTGNTITNWTIFYPEGNTSTINGTVILYPNLMNYTFNWTNEEDYFNRTEIIKSITGTSETLTITNIFARNITFNNSITGSTIEPTCTQDGYIYGSSEYLMHKSTNTTTCSLTGYQDKNLTLANIPDSNVYNLTPVQLNLIFTELTEGYIETTDCESLPNSCDWFNSTSILIVQSNISTGYVTIKFNNDGNNNWQQVFKYYNDYDTHVKEYIQIETPDLAKTVKISDNGDPIEDARVCSSTLGTNPDTNATEWLTTYCDYTDETGEVILLVNDQNTYKICTQKEGFTPNCEIIFITPSETTITQIEMNEISSTGGFNFVYTSCNPYVNGNTTCTLNVMTGKIYTQICVDYWTNSSSGTSCGSSTYAKTFTYTVDSTNTDWFLNVTLDGTIYSKFAHVFGNYSNITNEIDWDRPDNVGETMTDKLQGNSTYLIAFYIIMAIIGIIMGWMAEKYFTGYGIYGSAIWFGVLGTAGFYIFFVPCGVIVLRAIIQTVMPLMK